MRTEQLLPELRCVYEGGIRMEQEELKMEDEYREMRAKIAYLEEQLKDKHMEMEMARFRGIIEGLKFAIRCNGVSGAEVK